MFKLYVSSKTELDAHNSEEVLAKTPLNEAIKKDRLKLFFVTSNKRHLLFLFTIKIGFIG